VSLNSRLESNKEEHQHLQEVVIEERHGKRERKRDWSSEMEREREGERERAREREENTWRASACPSAFTDSVFLVKRDRESEIERERARERERERERESTRERARAGGDDLAGQRLPESLDALGLPGPGGAVGVAAVP